MKSNRYTGGAAAAVLLSALAAAACSGGPGARDFEPGIRAYLAGHGRICVGKRDWPIDVTPREFAGHARNGIQMPALERLGLVASSDAEVTVRDEDMGTTQTVRVKRYDLTAEGRKSYLPGIRYRARDHSEAVGSDLCAAVMSLDRVAQWTPPKPSGGRPATTVSYTYRIEPMPWAATPVARAAFPVIANLIDGAGKARMQLDFVKTERGWEPAS